MIKVLDDECQTLQDDEVQLTSYGLYGLYGGPGTGKTYMMNKINNKFVEHANKCEYDINNSHLNNGPLTHNVYMAPQLRNDLTMKNNMKDLTRIEIDDDKMLTFCEIIQKMGEDVGDVIDFQNKIKTENDRIQLKIINRIEEAKKKYPELKIRNADADISNIYDKFQLKYDGYFVRRQKIGIRFDDFQGSKLTNKSLNEFYKILVTRRHLGIWFTLLGFHTFSNTTASILTIQNHTLLYAGIDYEDVQKLFDSLPRIQTATFGKEQYIQLYKSLQKYQFLSTQQYPDVYCGVSFGPNQTGRQ